MATAVTAKYGQTSAMRVYIPATLADLSSDHLTARLVFTAGEDVRAHFDDEETAELYAFQRAADESVRCLARAQEAAADDETGPPDLRRVVVAAEIPSVGEAAGEDPACFASAGPVEWRDVVAIHVDDAGAREPVSRAVSSGAESAFDALAGVPMLWFDVSERHAIG